MRRDRRHLARFRDVEVWLPYSEFNLLCDLVLARFHSATVLVAVPVETVFRLRQHFESALGPDTDIGSIIETGSDGEYRLALAIELVGWDVSFAELPAKYLSSDSNDEILRRCRELKSV